MRGRDIVCLLSALIPVACCCSPARAATLAVPADYLTVQGAIEAAATGDEVVISPGTYHERLDFLGKAITVRSTDPANRSVVEQTIIDGEAGGSVVTFNTAETIASVLTGVTITNGRATSGGGIYCTSRPTISYNIIQGNTATADGGGIYTESRPTLTGNVIAMNSAVNGAGVYSLYGPPYFTGNTFVGNVASQQGGGFYHDWSGPSLYNCSFIQNIAGQGGGVYCGTNSVVTLGRCTVSGNTASAGGGVYVNDAAGNGPMVLRVYDSIISFSTGSGITAEDSSAVSLSYSDSYGNSGGNWVGTGTLTGPGNISADPLFVNAAGGDFHLKSEAGHYTATGWVADPVSSPCLDAGQLSHAYAAEPEPNGKHVDMGAYANTAEASRSPEMVKLLETGVCWTTIQPAIDASVSGQTVRLRPGTYVGCLNLGGKDITLRGQQPDDWTVVAATVVDADGKGSAVTVADGEGPSCVISGLTITAGTGTLSERYRGGGIYCKLSSPTITRNIIEGNGNSSVDGAGIYSSSGSPTVASNIIRNNALSSSGGGGGIYLEQGSPVISGNLVTGNRNGVGGGIYCYQTTALLSGNTVTGNRTTGGAGGGIYAHSSTVVLTNSIVSGSSSGGGVYVDGGSVSLSYCDVYGNSPANFSGVTDPTGSSGNISLDPLFADGAGGDYHLKSRGGHLALSGWVLDEVTSPCVDAGDPASAYDREPDPNGGRVNLGYEGNTAEASRQGSREPTRPTTLTVAPASPSCASTLQATAGGALDPLNVVASYKYEWAQVVSEGAPKRPHRARVAWGYPSTDGILSGATLHRGETWQVHACATNSAGDSAWSAPTEVTIANAVPSVPATLTVDPADPVATSSPHATAAGSTDSDTGDSVSYEYQWAPAGGGAEGEAVRHKDVAWGYDSTDGVLSGVTLHRGEIWQVHARATDSRDYSAWSSPVQVTIGNSAPSAPLVKVTPGVPRSASTLTAAATADDPDSDTLTYAYEWAKWEGASWGEWGHSSSDGVLGEVVLHKGEQWKARAQARDGVDAGPWQESKVVTVANTAPQAPTRVWVAPAKPTRWTDLTARTSGAVDVDGDSLTYRYQWSCSTNRGLTWSLWGTGGKVLPHRLVEAGQWWRVRCHASDGEVWSAWAVSAPVIIRNAAAPAGLLVAAGSKRQGRSGVALVVTLGQPASVVVRVHNLAGRPVATLAAEDLPPGASILYWSGRADNGSRAPAGIYVMRASATVSGGQRLETVLRIAVP